MLHMPVISVTWETEAGKSLELGGGGCSELRLHHYTPAWVTRAKLSLKKANKQKNQKMLDIHKANLHIHMIIILSF